jgi:hypothetical protein
MKTKVTLTIERQVWLDFRSACIAKSLVAGHLLEEFMQEQLKRWAKDRHEKEAKKK